MLPRQTSLLLGILLLALKLPEWERTVKERICFGPVLGEIRFFFKSTFVLAEGCFVSIQKERTLGLISAIFCLDHMFV